MSNITTDTLCTLLTEEATTRAESMANAGVESKSLAYRALSFDVVDAAQFRVTNEAGTLTDCMDMVMDAVEGRHPVEFFIHHDDNGQRTVTWVNT